MPLPTDFAALALYGGILDSPNFLFLEPNSGDYSVDLMVGTITGSRPLFTLNSKVLYDGSGNPSSSIYSGSTYSGDHYIDLTNNRWYSHDGITWGTGFSIVGPTGLAGPSGLAASGAAGVGVPASGERYQILAKLDDTDFNTGWLEVGDLNRGYYSSFGGRPSYYTEVYRNLNLRSDSGGVVSDDMGSGVTYCSTTNTLYVVDNGTPSISEYGIDGQHIRTINLSGFEDIEAIDYMGSDYSGAGQYNRFVIAEEYSAGSAAYLNKLHVIMIASDGSVTITNNPGVGTHEREIDLSAELTNAAPNVGIEGVAYNRDRDKFYVVTEKTANEGWKIWTVDNNSTVVISELFDLSTTLGLLSPPATDISDLSYRRSTNTLVLTSEESTGYILEFNLEGYLLDAMTIPTAFFQLEGVAFSDDGQLMFLTGEANTTGGDRPDYMIFEYNRTNNPTVDERSHGLTYFQNGIATAVKGKICEAVDPYFTATNNTNKSLQLDWPYGSINLQDKMLKRGKKLSFSSFGDFAPQYSASDTATLDFQVQDTGNVGVTPQITLTGVSCETTNYWKYDGAIVFADELFYNNSQLFISNPSGYVSHQVSSSSGLISALTTGNLDFVTKFSLPSTVGTMNIYQFSLDID